MSSRQRALATEINREVSAGVFRTEATHCVCGVRGSDLPIGDVDRYGLVLRTVVCEHCGSVRADPYFDEPSLRKFYGTYYQGLYDRAADPNDYFEVQKKYGRRVLDAIRRIAPRCRTALEIGCGAGGALTQLRDAGLITAGCDHSEELVRFGIEQGLSRLTVGDVSDLIASEPSLRDVDVVFLHHVFEHFSDPASFLRECKSVLSSSGVLIAIVPDISRIDAFPFPGGDVRLFLHIAHKFNYSRQGLRMLGARCGYLVEFIEGLGSQVSPEIWVVFRPGQSAVKSPVHKAGAQMLSYLRRTEARYRFGLLPGYQIGYRGRAKRLVKQLLPKPIVAWLSKTSNE